MLECWSVEDQPSFFCLLYNCESVSYGNQLPYAQKVVYYWFRSLFGLVLDQRRATSHILQFKCLEVLYYDVNV